MMSPAGSLHGRVVVRITTPLDVFVQQHALGVVLGAETGFRIGQNPDTVRAPDVAFISRDRWPSPPPKAFFPALRTWPWKSSRRRSRERGVGKSSRLVGRWLPGRLGRRSETGTVTVHRGRSAAELLRRGEQLTGGDLLPGSNWPSRKSSPRLEHAGQPAESVPLQPQSNLLASCLHPSSLPLHPSMDFFTAIARRHSYRGAFSAAPVPGKT